MEFHELLRRRRMVRHYVAEPVARESLERIVSTIRRAPSAGYSQGQRLLVVTEPALRAELAALFDAGGAGVEPWFETAPAHVFVLTREDDYHERYRREDKLRDGKEIDWPVPYWHVDAGAALMLVLLAALDEGLATGVYGIPVELQPRVRELLRIPGELAVVAGVTVGRGAADPGWSARASRATRPRKPLDELVQWERWE